MGRSREPAAEWVNGTPQHPKISAEGGPGALQTLARARPAEQRWLEPELEAATESPWEQRAPGRAGTRGRQGRGAAPSPPLPWGSSWGTPGSVGRWPPQQPGLAAPAVDLPLQRCSQPLARRCSAVAWQQERVLFPTTNSISIEPHLRPLPTSAQAGKLSEGKCSSPNRAEGAPFLYSIVQGPLH